MLPGESKMYGELHFLLLKGWIFQTHWDQEASTAAQKEC